jgi:hypothetical protein
MYYFNKRKAILQTKAEALTPHQLIYDIFFKIKKLFVGKNIKKPLIKYEKVVYNNICEQMFLYCY